VNVTRWPNAEEVVRRQVVRHSGGAVQSGPFSGMLLDSHVVSWGSGDMCPKLLGTYEEELHRILEDQIAPSPPYVVNLGCAERYYSIGLAMRLRGSTIFSVDICNRALKATDKNARLNGVGNVRTINRSTEVQVALVLGDQSLWIVDVEGAEGEILQQIGLERFQSASLLIELHPFVDRRASLELLERLSLTHKIQLIDQAGRNPNSIPFLTGLSDSSRWAAVNEGRPEKMQWLYAVPIV